ncbi:MAG: Type 1 glutamine amidotransferase-like domain-containing protein [bacterium]|nr:Type 1 glutamine amidotransferase-like domain-containing protein [bacterium]
MKLLLTSAGFTNKSIAKACEELTGKPLKKLKLAFVPTAANVEEGDKDWLINDLYRTRKLFKEVDIIDISAVGKEIWEPRLRGADVLMFGGGNSFHLMNCLEKSGLKDLLPELLKTKVYVGISAGSICCGPSLKSLKSWYYPDLEDEKGDIALKFVNFHFRPHLNSKWFPKVREEILEEFAKEFPEPFYALDDQSAIKVDGEKVTIVSEGVWKKFN